MPVSEGIEKVGHFVFRMGMRNLTSGVVFRWHCTKSTLNDLAHNGTARVHVLHLCQRWHFTKSSDCQVRVRGAPSHLYGVNVTKAVIGAYM